MPRQTKPKITQHHTKDAKVSIRVRDADLGAFEVNHLQKAAGEYVYIRMVTDLYQNGVKIFNSVTVYTSNAEYKLSMWTAQEVLSLLKKHGIPYSETVYVKELVGTTQVSPATFISEILDRIPRDLTSAIPWIIDDERRYLVVTTGARRDFPKEERANIIRVVSGSVILMTDDQDQAVAIKLRRNGSIFDMQEIRANS